MLIVRRGVSPRRRLASCCSVEVMNGGDGLRWRSPRLTEPISHAAFSTAAMTSSTSFFTVKLFFLSAVP